MTYAYIRVSTRDQNEDHQLAALTSLGISEVNLFLDKQSGKDFNRPAYRKLSKKLKPGDLLIIKSIDRLGRKIRGRAETCTGDFNERAVIRTGKQRHKIHRSDK